MFIQNHKKHGISRHNMSHDKVVNINTLVSEIDQQIFDYLIGGFERQVTTMKLNVFSRKNKIVVIKIADKKQE